MDPSRRRTSWRGRGFGLGVVRAADDETHSGAASRPEGIAARPPFDSGLRVGDERVGALVRRGLEPACVLSRKRTPHYLQRRT